MASLTGRTLGHFRIGQEIGRGGMAVVYEALDTSMERNVALKVLSPLLAEDPVIVQRFQREAQAGARLSHPNIADVFGLEEVDGIYCISMERVYGASLAKRIETNGPLSIRQAVGITRSIAAALSTAHAQGILHRDIKPQNILLEEDGTPRMVDFGLARMLFSSSTSTIDSARLGTLSYMSPEQCRGGKMDPRSDIYSLGVVLFQMLTGEAPFQADSSVGLIHQILQAPFPDVCKARPDAPPALARILAGMVARNRDERYATAEQLINDLDAFLSGAEVPGQSGVLPGLSGVDGTGFDDIVGARKPIPPRVRVQQPIRIPRSAIIIAAGVLALAGLTWLVTSLPKGSSVQTRTLHFPEDRSIGLVGTWEPQDYDTWGTFFEFSYDVLGEAQGALTVPPGRYYGLFLRADALEEWDTIESLGAEGLSGFQTDSPTVDDAFLARLSQLTSLRAVDIEFGNVTDAGVAHLQALPNLEYLSLSRINVTGEVLRTLASFPRLRYLNIHYCHIGDDHLQYLADFPMLRVLGLPRSDVTDAGLPKLYGLSDLRSFRSGGYASVTEAGMKRLKQALPKCCVVFDGREL